MAPLEKRIGKSLSVNSVSNSVRSVTQFICGI